MTTQHDKAKRWRPRFSIRTLVILVTLACVVLALWLATNAQGIVDVELVAGQECEVAISRVVLPLVVETLEVETNLLDDLIQERAEAALDLHTPPSLASVVAAEP